MLVKVASNYLIRGTLKTRDESAGPWDLTVPLANGHTARVHLNAQTKALEVESFTEVSDGLAQALKSNRPLIDYDATLEQERGALLDATRTPARRVVALVKYVLNHVELNETLSTSGLFSHRWKPANEPDAEWLPVPPLLTTLFDPRSFDYLSDESVAGIQHLLESEYRPMYALRHLHLAIRAGDAKSKWIDATIAAELAIKEFLIRKEPKLRGLLFELPAPPIDLLYGRVLQTYAGEPYPGKNRLAEGAKMRNRLLHRPGEAEVGNHEAIVYVQDVTDAIVHLLILLDPEDRFAKLMRRAPRVLRA